MSTVLPTVLACGAWLKNAACLLSPEGVRWSPVHGDLGEPAACRALDESLHRLLRDAGGPVAAVAHDLHPDFFSTRLGLTLADELGVPAIGVQHHHAHIAAVMAEHGIDEPVVGLALDGVGLGTDGTAWGGECLWVAPGDWARLGRLLPLALPGGDVAAREPWRMAASALHAMGRSDEIVARFGPRVGTAAAQLVQRLLARDLHCPPTSSTGRWFDAAAAVLGLSVRQSHEAEAAIALEQQARVGLTDFGRPAGTAVIAADAGTLDLRPLIAALLDRVDARGSVSAAAAWFHVALAEALADWAAAAAARRQVSTVCLGGGCFLNAVLSEYTVARLHRHGLRVLRPQAHSCGDAALAYGQAWAAAQQLHRGTGERPAAYRAMSPCV